MFAISNATNQNLTVDQFSLAPGQTEDVAALSPNMVVALNAGLLVVTQTTDTHPGSSINNQYGSNAPLTALQITEALGYTPGGAAAPATKTAQGTVLQAAHQPAPSGGTDTVTQTALGNLITALQAAGILASS